MEEIKQDTRESARAQDLEGPVLITASAARMLQKIRRDNEIDEAIPLRIFLAGVACSGPQFGLGFDENSRQGDQEFASAGIQLIVDPHSLQYLSGATVEYVKANGREGFRIHNPELMMGCGDTDPGAGGGCPGCG